MLVLSFYICFACECLYACLACKCQSCLLDVNANNLHVVTSGQSYHTIWADHWQRCSTLLCISMERLINSNSRNPF
ncbi:hypothetical protein BGW37DRAFT_485229 [Umbelopsis sp. PMI_123]|nr:hypothetical protein BGW37DRAFT_485229 [Umbelopsis sp. PMI_123]